METQNNFFQAFRIKRGCSFFNGNSHYQQKRGKKMVGKFWKGKHYWSFGTNLARGAGILLAKDLDYKFINHTHDFDGRTVVLDIEMGCNKYRLINCYAPNNPTERKRYIEDLDIYLISSYDPILGGDWNFVENLELDKWGGNMDNGADGKIQIQKLKKQTSLKIKFYIRIHRGRIM